MNSACEYSATMAEELLEHEVNNKACVKMIKMASNYIMT